MPVSRQELDEQSRRFPETRRNVKADTITEVTVPVPWDRMHCVQERCKNPVVSVVWVERGCVRYPDAVQCLCLQHLESMTNLGDAYEIVRRYE